MNKECLVFEGEMRRNIVVREIAERRSSALIGWKRSLPERESELMTRVRDLQLARLGSSQPRARGDRSAVIAILQIDSTFEGRLSSASFSTSTYFWTRRARCGGRAIEGNNVWSTLTGILVWISRST
jgi:hypothetical protein